MRGLSSFAALVLLCAASLPAAGASAVPGSVEPADTTRPSAAPPAANPAPPAETDNSTAAAPTKTVKRVARKHRSRDARYRIWRHGFIIPPPQYWFRPWPRHRSSRGHRRA